MAEKMGDSAGLLLTLSVWTIGSWRYGYLAL